MASKKAALGKGLNALLPHDDEGDLSRDPSGDMSQSKLYRFEDRVRLLGRVADIEIDHIRPNPYQPRRDFKEETLDELAASIRELGIIQPITVRALGGGQFEVISGERRVRAARRAGIKRVPAYVREADSEAMLEMALVENVQREELNPVEVALGYHRLIEECGLTQEQVADKIGKSRTTVTNFLRLLKLPPRVQACLRDKTVSVGHARALITIDEEEVQLGLLDEIRDEDLTVRDVEQRVRAWREAKEAPPSPEPEPPAPSPAKPDRDDLQVKEFAKQLRSYLSTQVQIKHKKDGSGRITIEYYADEDLERLMELLLDG
jgi:ParB family chromosome partitioning protein